VAGEDGDRLGGLALQPGELAFEDGQGMVALFGAVEVGQVTLGEGDELSLAGGDGRRREFGVSEQGLGFGGLEDLVHGGPHNRYRRSV
jgi:hypothetical protein